MTHRHPRRIPSQPTSNRLSKAIGRFREREPLCLPTHRAADTVAVVQLEHMFGPGELESAQADAGIRAASGLRALTGAQVHDALGSCSMTYAAGSRCTPN